MMGTGERWRIVVNVEILQVMVVDDHPLFAEALAARLSNESDINVPAIACSVDRALSIVDAAPPTVLILDLVLGEESGFIVLRAVRRDHPEVRVIMLSATSDIDCVVEAIRLGARAWVPKSTEAQKLVEVIRSVARGGGWLPEEMFGGALDRLTHVAEPVSDELKALTSRERQLLQCMIDGIPRSEIANRLFLSPNTVRTHAQNLLAKLQCHSLLEAVALARRSGMRPSADALL
ncbi:MAG TPA: response regulator transcription factor [Jatrophihabitans sp.]|jgi:DNA-binding NarL/FixJ family response regulator